MSGSNTAPTTVVSAKPVVLSAPGRREDLQVRVSAPATGTDLPVIVFSHGFGWSMSGYAPLADHWAAQGFVVLQPTHLDSRTLGIPMDDPRFPRIWRHRIEDLGRVLDGLDVLEAAVPGLTGRSDRNRIAAAGHSWGAQTASTSPESSRPGAHLPYHRRGPRRAGHGGLTREPLGTVLRSGPPRPPTNSPGSGPPSPHLVPWSASEPSPGRPASEPVSH
jgi:dienelactone hydrolase